MPQELEGLKEWWNSPAISALRGSWPVEVIVRANRSWDDLIEIAEAAEHALESLVERDWLEDGSILPHPAREALRHSLGELKGK